MGCINAHKKVSVSKEINQTSPFGTHPLQSSTNLDKKKILDLLNNYTVDSNIEIKNLVTKLKDKVYNYYNVIKTLGQGSYGKVLLVKHKKSEEIRAMKIISKDNLKYQDGEQNFLKELNILLELEHPNILKIFEYYLDCDNYYLITEYVAGGTLIDALLKAKHINEQKAAFIINQILKALHYLHRKNIIHRDIKPENILVEANNDGFLYVKIIDFGLSNYFSNDQKLTLKVGSPFYIAPEVLRHNYNYKCDIWSCGVVLHLLLIGQFPFFGKTKDELFYNILNYKFAVKIENSKKISDSVKDLLRNMLKYDFEKRFDAAQCLEHPWLSKFRSNNGDSVDPNFAINIIKNLASLQMREKLQQATIAYLTYNFYKPTYDNGALQNLFSTLDINEDGFINFEEFYNAIKKYYEKDDLPPKEELQNIFNEIDNNSDNSISYEEFIRATVDVKRILTLKNLKMAFDHFDLNKDGKLSKEEIKHALNTSDNTYVEKLANAIDTNNDGFVSFEEFTALMEQLKS